MKNYEEFLKKFEEMDLLLHDPLVATEFAKQYYPTLAAKKDLQVHVKLDDRTIYHMYRTIFYSERDNVTRYSDYIVKHVAISIYASYYSRLTKRKDNLLLDTIDKTFVMDIANDVDYVVRGGYYYIFANRNSVEIYYGYSGRLLLVNTIDDVVTGLNYLNRVRRELEHKYPELYKQFMEIYHGGSK